jgi:hypothetical protein
MTQTQKSYELLGITQLQLGSEAFNQTLPDWQTLMLVGPADMNDGSKQG